MIQFCHRDHFHFIVMIPDIADIIGKLDIVASNSYLTPGIGGICVCGVEAGVGGFRSPPSAIELLVD